jgi:uncharacterized phiE125 gp8 family phage protein
MWDRLSQVAPLAAAPVSLGEAKLHLRVDHLTDDPLIQVLIDAAVASIAGKDGKGIPMVSQQWLLRLDAFPVVIGFPMWPVISVDEVAYTDPAGASQILASSEYQTDLTGNPARLAPAYGKSWPAIRAVLGAVRIKFTAGYASASLVPADLRQAVLLLVGHLYTNRDAAVLGVAVADLPHGVDAILDRYRVGRFA